jgi:hypothetical protein
MLRHIVTWKMNGQTSHERQRQAEQVVEAIAPLRDLVPTVKALDLYINELNAEKNWDVTVIVDFEDEEGLEIYANHPEHQEVLKLISRVTEERAGIDATVSS